MKRNVLIILTLFFVSATLIGTTTTSAYTLQPSSIDRQPSLVNSWEIWVRGIFGGLGITANIENDGDEPYEGTWIIGLYNGGWPHCNLVKIVGQGSITELDPLDPDERMVLRSSDLSKVFPGKYNIIVTVYGSDGSLDGIDNEWAYVFGPFVYRIPPPDL